MSLGHRGGDRYSWCGSTSFLISLYFWALLTFVSPFTLLRRMITKFRDCSVINTYDPNQRRIYELVVRQEPKQARMCGVGGKGTFIIPLRPTHLTYNIRCS